MNKPFSRFGRRVPEKVEEKPKELDHFEKFSQALEVFTNQLAALKREHYRIKDNSQDKISKLIKEKAMLEQQLKDSRKKCGDLLLEKHRLLCRSLLERIFNT